MNSRYLYLSWLFLVLAICLWSIFGFIIWRVGIEREEYATLISDITVNEQRERAAMRLRGVLRDSTQERQTLEQLLDTDLIAAVSTIEAAGAAAGVTIATDNATSDQLAEGLRSITVIGSADGSLTEMLRALTLFETLPFPAVVESMDLESSRDGADWNMRYRIRLVTTSQNNL